METYEGISQGFNATEGRQKIIQRLVLEFAGVELRITPTKTPGDFMNHVNLNFISVEQREAFLRRMLEIGRQELHRRDSGQPSTNP